MAPIAGEEAPPAPSAGGDSYRFTKPGANAFSQRKLIFFDETRD